MTQKQNPWARETIEKGRGPFGGKIVPEKFNGTAPAANIGGWEDANTRRAATMSNTARRGSGAGASQTDKGPDQKPPTPAPGGGTGNKANPWAPPSQQEHMRAKGARQGSSAASMASSMTSLARKGGAKIPLSPDRQAQAALPEPAPSFPKAAAPRGGKPVPAPKGSGSMAGVIQGPKGINPGQSNLALS
jgi:hypothetical protein